jgi:Amt family ammonium transporter
MKISESFAPLARAAVLGTLALTAFGTLAAFAQETAPPAADAAAAAAPVPDKGDTSWMMVSTILVLFMILPGLALFYGGLVRAKNMLSVLMQCTMIVAVVMIVWVLYGYSFAFGGGTSPYWGGLGKLFLAGVTPDSTAATFSEGVVIPEFVFICFQMTFACITPALIIGAFAERIKFSAVLLFVVLWVTFVYFPIAHMVWDASGLLFGWGALDFAGGTVVHINAGIAALVGSIMVGKRSGYGRDNMAPHSMTLTMVGASILWVGWFGFNAGSNLEATGGAALAMMNSFVATAAAAMSWMFAEWLIKGKPSLLGALSGCIAGLVAVTPAAGYAGPMGALVLGLIVGVVCLYFCTTIKNALGYDDALDVFGVHCIGGIVGAIGTGILVNPLLGGVGIVDYTAIPPKVADYDFWAQLISQCTGVLVTLVWSGVGSFIIYKVVDILVGLRVSVEQEREGLDLTDHGERAYTS